MKIDTVYAKPDHPDNQFPGLYHPEAKLIWCHQDLALVVLIAARTVRQDFGWTLKINDGLRPVEAQEKMQDSHFHPDLVSAPGKGAHPRAMAVDVEPLDHASRPVEMGTSFDYFAQAPGPDVNPAHREYSGAFQDADKNLVNKNRNRLSHAMLEAGRRASLDIVPLPQEWWDFRFPPDIVYTYAPLRDRDLRPVQRMIEPDVSEIKALMAGHLTAELLTQKETILEKLERIR